MSNSIKIDFEMFHRSEMLELRVHKRRFELFYLYYELMVESIVTKGELYESTMLSVLRACKIEDGGELLDELFRLELTIKRGDLVVIPEVVSSMEEYND